MVTEKTLKIIENSRASGWVMEPDAKKIMAWHGFDIPGFYLGNSVKEAGVFFKQCPSMVVAKCVSPQIIHKTEFGAVITNINTLTRLKTVFETFRQMPGYEAVLVEEMIQGIELFVGARIDYQFGPVVILGIGGTGVEIYKDTAIRMAPLKPSDVLSMVNSLTGKQIINGYRRKPGVNMDVLIHLVVEFSHMVCRLESVISDIDLNPVICTPDRCVVADARIIIPSGPA